MGELAIRMVVSLLVVVGLMLLVAKVAVKRNRTVRDTGLQVIGRQQLGKGSGLAVVTVGGRTLLLGTTDNQVNLITELTDQSAVPASLGVHDDLDTDLDLGTDLGTDLDADLDAAVQDDAFAALLADALAAPAGAAAPGPAAPAAVAAPAASAPAAVPAVVADEDRAWSAPLPRSTSALGHGQRVDGLQVAGLPEIRRATPAPAVPAAPVVPASSAPLETVAVAPTAPAAPAPPAEITEIAEITEAPAWEPLALVTDAPTRRSTPSPVDALLALAQADPAPTRTASVAPARAASPAAPTGEDEAARQLARVRAAVADARPVTPLDVADRMGSTVRTDRTTTAPQREAATALQEAAEDDEVARATAQAGEFIAALSAALSATEPTTAPPTVPTVTATGPKPARRERRRTRGGVPVPGPSATPASSTPQGPLAGSVLSPQTWRQAAQAVTRRAS
ncbi:flagellar biosynthetic protein FliO [Nocardioides bruguierae]|uniref:flagellar biosynthetic protein FliO n=1 Tax=Nocardioides bruguierae TaxID=2945102 RepID=UPI002020695F|nr:flagellar biosynthetic protein FliO [Nocardioides bruguierae]MCL8027685.1 flagellar biosynthetic protein FliO [Nocardioides bruguierae]